MFENRAGCNVIDNNAILTTELHNARIPILTEIEKCSDTIKELLSNNSGEVATSIIGYLHGWTFKRAWKYWVADGPGIPISTADRLHLRYGNTLRVGGYAGGKDPRELYNGFSVGLYHIDTPEALKAFAIIIKDIAMFNDTILEQRKYLKDKETSKELIY